MNKNSFVLIIGHLYSLYLKSRRIVTLFEYTMSSLQHVIILICLEKKDELIRLVIGFKFDHEISIEVEECSCGTQGFAQQSAPSTVIHRAAVCPSPCESASFSHDLS